MNLFGKKIIRYPLNSFELIRLRESIPLSVEQFAAIVGWSPAYQYKLESGKVKTVSAKTANEICSAFSRCGCKITEQLN